MASRLITYTVPFLSISWIALVYCANLNADGSSRWYNPEQVEQGARIFQQHCAGCHGHNAESTPEWNQTDASGNYPPPPLNGSAHTWHHDLPLLRKTIREGGQKLGGLMPPFENLLTDPQINSVIAFFQSLWPHEIYSKWATRFNISSSLSSGIPDTTYLKQRLGNIDIGKPAVTPMQGIYEIRFKEKMLYLSEDGEFAFIGEMIDLKNGINVSKQKR